MPNFTYIFGYNYNAKIIKIPQTMIQFQYRLPRFMDRSPRVAFFFFFSSRCTQI